MEQIKVREAVSALSAVAQMSIAGVQAHSNGAKLTLGIIDAEQLAQTMTPHRVDTRRDAALLVQMTTESGESSALSRSVVQHIPGYAPDQFGVKARDYEISIHEKSLTMHYDYPKARNSYTLMGMTDLRTENPFVLPLGELGSAMCFGHLAPWSVREYHKIVETAVLRAADYGDALIVPLPGSSAVGSQIEVTNLLLDKAVKLFLNISSSNRAAGVNPTEIAIVGPAARMIYGRYNRTIFYGLAKRLADSHASFRDLNGQTVESLPKWVKQQKAKLRSSRAS